MNDDIKIVVLGVKEKQVRLGIEAPREVSVHRQEIYDRIHNGKGLSVKKTKRFNPEGFNACLEVA